MRIVMKARDKGYKILSNAFGSQVKYIPSYRSICETFLFSNQKNSFTVSIHVFMNQLIMIGIYARLYTS